jgi:hypothetical protein
MNRFANWLGAPALLALAFLYLIPKLLLLLALGPFDPRNLDDWDEAYYLALPYDAKRLFEAVGSPLSLTINELLPSNIPHEVVDLVFAQLLLVVEVSPVILASIFDLILVPASTVAFFVLFAQLGFGVWASVIAAATSVFLPWIGAWSALFPITSAGTSSLAMVPHNFFPSLPAERAIYTQLSIPFFALSLALLARLLKENWRPLRLAAILGATHGLLLYLYFFAWGSAVVLTVITPICLSLAGVPKFRLRNAVLGMTVYLTSLGLISAPGIAILFGGGELITPGPQHTLADPFPFYRYWFLSPFDLMIGAAALIAVRLTLRCRDSQLKGPPKLDHSPITLALVLLAGSSFAIHVLMNLQPILGRWLTPYHFPLFYLHPLISGLLIVLLTEFVRSRRGQLTLTTTCLIATLAQSWLPLFSASSLRSDWAEERELFGKLSAFKRYSLQVASLPFSSVDPLSNKLEYLLLPYWVKTLGEQQSLSQFMGFSPDRDLLVRRELLLGVLFFGEPRLIGPCPDQRDIDIHGDILTGAEAFHSFQRRIDCSIGDKIRETISSCQLISSLESKQLYLILNRTIVDPRPAWLLSAGERVWSSDSSILELWWSERSKLISFFCDSPGPENPY